MSQVSIVRIEGDAPNLSVLRQAVVEAAVGVYGAKVTYAYGLNMTFGVSLGWSEVTDHDGNVIDLQPEVSGWFDQEHKAMSPDVAAEKTAFYDALKKAEHSNPSKVWADVRAYGRRHALEQAEQLCKAEIDLRGIEMPNGTERPDPLAPEQRGANDVRSIRLRMVEDLCALYKAAKREKSLATEEANALVHITSALIAIGVDLTTLAK
jgi:hypothetical protein